MFVLGEGCVLGGCDYFGAPRRAVRTGIALSYIDASPACVSRAASWMSKMLNDNFSIVPFAPSQVKLSMHTLEPWMQ